MECWETGGNFFFILCGDKVPARHKVPVRHKAPARHEVPARHKVPARHNVPANHENLDCSIYNRPKNGCSDRCKIF